MMQSRAWSSAAAALALPFLMSMTPVQAPSTLTDADRRAVVEAAARALREQYVFPDVARRAAEAIESSLADGHYSEFAAPAAFARRLTEDLEAVAHDKHLRVFMLSAASGAAPSPAPENEGGVTRADILGGNVGYLEIVGFPPPGVFRAPVSRAMAALRDTRAVIVDVRRNGGGNPASVAYLVSYFLDAAEPVHINTFILRNQGTDTFRSQEFRSEQTPVSFAGKPVTVLTSDFTFSGGEEFAYDMQVMELGELVGETTRGGANPGGTVPLAAGLTMFVPNGRAENPITKTNWEGAGVVPDVAVSSGTALRVALERLGVAPAGSGVDELSVRRVFEPAPRRTTQQPGAEAAIRRLSAEVASGSVDFGRLAPDLAAAVRPQLPSLQAQFSALGAVQSVTFVEVTQVGADIFDVQYANGALRWTILLAPDGAVMMAAVTARERP